MRIVKPIMSIIFRSKGLPRVGSTLRMRGGNGEYMVRISRRLKGGVMHYVVLDTDRNLRHSERIVTAKDNVGIPMNSGALKHLFGMLNSAMSSNPSLRKRRG